MPRVILKPPAWKSERSLGFDGKVGRLGTTPMYRLRVFLPHRLVATDGSVALDIFRDTARTAMFREYRMMLVNPTQRFSYAGFFADESLTISDSERQTGKGGDAENKSA